MTVLKIKPTAVTRHRVTGTVDTEVIVYFMVYMRELRVALLE